MTDADQFLSFSTPSGGKYFIWTRWMYGSGGLEGLSATLVGGNFQVWREDVSIDQLNQLATRADIESPAYIDLTKKAFGGSSASGDRPLFAYDVVLDDGKAQLSWKKIIPDKGYYNLGLISMDPVEDGSAVLVSLLERCGQRCSSLSQRLLDSVEENFRLSEEHKRACERLTEAAQAKNDVEERFLQQFLCILNAKKRKIFELTQEVSHLREQLSSGQLNADANTEPRQPDVVKKATKKKPPSKLPNDVDDHGVDTDEEREHIERVRQNALNRRSQTISDMPLIVTHEDGTMEKAGLGSLEVDRVEGANGEDKEEDHLFVPKRRRKQPKRYGVAQPAATSRKVPNKRQPVSPSLSKSSPGPSIDLNSPRQTRSTSSGTMDMISKLS